MTLFAMTVGVTAQQQAPPPLVQQGGGGRGDGAGARQGGAGRGNAPSLPAPRWPDGRINFGAPKGESGVWERRNEHLVNNPNSYQAAATRTRTYPHRPGSAAAVGQGADQRASPQRAGQRAVYAVQAVRRSSAADVAVRSRDRRLAGTAEGLHLQRLERAELPHHLHGRPRPSRRIWRRAISDTRSDTGKGTRWSSTASASTRASG